MRNTILALTVAMASSTTASAADFSFTGTFSQDDDVQIFNFSVGAPSIVTLRTYSYAGGIQADGNVVSAGGFDPILALFDATGVLIAENDDGPGVPSDPTTGARFDTELTTTLGIGAYSVSIMQYNNFAAGGLLSDGFLNDGLGNFTAGFGGCSASAFCDVAGDSRSNEWAFDILNVETATTAPIPVPAALPLLLGGLAALGLIRRRA